MLKTGCLFFCLLCCLLLGAQDFSNKGKDFWITFPAHVDQLGAVMGVYITSDEAASGSVQVGTSNIAFSITPNTVKRVFIGPGGDAGNGSVYLSQLDGIKTGAGIHVIADNPVVVYAHIIFKARSGASLLLPSNVWGKDYLVPSMSSSGQSGVNSGAGIITVLAKEANTTVEITPTVNSMNGARTAGVPYTINLGNVGDVYQVQFTKDADISGTTVKSIASGGVPCKPIAVFSATTWSAFDCIGPSGGDNLYQQLFPTRSFGKSFITAPFFRRNYDIIRVFVLDPATVVKRTENGVTTTLTGLTNSYYQIKTNLPNKIEADKPISVVQYITSQSCYNNNFPADPEMVILNPTEQTINNITVFSAHQNFVPPGQSNVNECFLNIIIKTNAAGSFKINGKAPTGSFNAIPGTGYSYLQENVSTLSATNPVQTLIADSNFSAVAYGYGNVESYGYNAGTNVKDLYQYITLKNTNATVATSATCVNTPFQFQVILPYKTSSLKWVFNGVFPDVTVPNPAPDSSYILDDKTLYRYTLTNNFNATTLGSFPISVVTSDPGSDGCNGEQQIDFQLEVFAKPRAYFTWQHSGCVTDPITFTDKSDASFGTKNRWSWSFGDGTTDQSQNPSKKYNAAGSFTVKQTVLTDVGCEADSTATIQITSVPVAKFSTTGPYCRSAKINITEASTIAVGAIKYWYWDYGNGKKDTLTSNASPNIIYTAAGSYTISLTVESTSGCTSTAFTQTISVAEKPLADFTPPGVVCLPAGSANFVNKSTVNDGSALSYGWDFGDGGTASIKDPVHKYLGGGPFTVKLTATSTTGCMHDTSKVLNNIFDQPKADFSFKEVCFGAISNFTDASVASNQVINTYGWDLGDQVILNTKDVSKTYTKEGSYSIKHWVSSNVGCTSDTTVKTYNVFTKPLAQFTTDAAACQLKPLNFVSQTAATPVISKWSWDFGDGTKKDVTNGDPLPYTYAAVGVKNVSLVVTSTQGCVSDTARKSLEVNLLPKADFGLPEVCLADAFAKFTDSSSIADGSQSAFSYLWNFADPNANAANPNTATQANPTHKYNAAAIYNVSLQVTSGKGCVATSTKQLTVNGDKPKANFNIVSAAGTCSNAVVEISNQSSVNFGNITKIQVYWEWPSTAVVTTDDDPVANKSYQHLYPVFNSPATKTFSIRYLAYSGTVCVDEMIKQVQLSAVPKINFQPIPGICLSASPRQVTQATEASNLPGNGIFSGTGINAAGLFTPSTAGVGTFPIRYIFTTANGCADTASQNITVWPNPTASFTVDSPVCANKAATFTDASAANAGSISKWDWVFGDGTSTSKTTGSPFQKTYTADADYNVSLTVTTSNNCTGAAFSRLVKIHPLPVVDFALPLACARTPVQFFDNSNISDSTQASFKYQWQFVTAGASSTLKDPIIAFPGSNNQTIQLSVTSGTGCVNSTTKTLTGILPQPLANFDMSPTAMCLGGVFTLTDKSNPLSQSIVSWNWNFGDGNTDSTRDASHGFNAAGNYNIAHSYITDKGCQSDTIKKQAIVYPYPKVNAGPDIVVVEGTSKTIAAQVTGSTNNTYLWSPASYLSATNILQPITSPVNAITYTIKVTGEGGCASTDEVLVEVAGAPIVPNAFSPNGDGINDTWYIKYLEYYPGATVNVFDRYGRQVYASIGYSRPWDGTLHGNPLPLGVYYYVIDPKSGKNKISGSLTILR